MPSFLFRLAAFFLLAGAIQQTCAATTDLSAMQSILSKFENLANNTVQQARDDVIELLETIIGDFNSTNKNSTNNSSSYNNSSDKSVRMLYTYEEQADIFKRLFRKDPEELEELLAEPDACGTIESYMGFIFDNAVDLLSHRAGRKHDLMRGFQQVLHMRGVLKAVLIKQDRPLDESVSEEICIDKAFIAIYGWVKGTLIGEARSEGTFVTTIPESTDDQKASLATKREIVATTTLEKELDLNEVKPLPGVDYPE